MDHKESCRKLLNSLSDYVDGTLGEQLCDDIERHLANCEDCRIVVDTLRKTVYLVHATSEPEPVPADVRQRLYHRLDLDEYLGS
jgi:anti-sigma factor (TIGR02949 family)